MSIALLVSALLAGTAQPALPPRSSVGLISADPVTTTAPMPASAGAPTEPAVPPPEAAPPPPRLDQPPVVEPTVAEQILDGRRRPGFERGLPDQVTQDNPGAIRALPPQAFPTDTLPIPDRWRLITALCPTREVFVAIAAVCQSRLDPYHHNPLKGDRPLNLTGVPSWIPFNGDDWFITLSAISDTVVEPRSFPIPVGVSTTQGPDSNNVFGRNNSLVLGQTFIFGASLAKGMTAFRPPDIEYRIAVAANFNYVTVPERRVLYVEPTLGTTRFDYWVGGLQEAFIDKHLGNDSSRYDFHSIRIGIQPFQTDFRGFLFNDNQLGVRLFGNRDNNRFQYNIGAFWRLEKDTNSGLNDVTQTPRRDWFAVANLYRQDLPVPGMTSQVTVVYNRNREDNRVTVDKNGFPIRPALFGTLRPRHYDVTYVGYNADGRFGRLNLTMSLYGAFGQDIFNPITDRVANITAYFGAAELSYDHDWMRFRLSGLYASGDSDPYDDTEGGFDAIFENPIFAGADTSYWIRQTIPFAGGGRAVSVNGRNGILNSLRSSKEQGQSNFTNPGTALIGLGGDFDVLPSTRVSVNVNHLWFAHTAVIEVLRNQGSISTDIGWDTSVSAIWRPNTNQNMVMRLSAAALIPGAGFDQLFTNRDRQGFYYSILANATFTF